MVIEIFTSSMKEEQSIQYYERNEKHDMEMGRKETKVRFLFQKRETNYHLKRQKQLSPLLTQSIPPYRTIISSLFIFLVGIHISNR